jgi:hypothetical protein
MSQPASPKAEKTNRSVPRAHDSAGLTGNTPPIPVTLSVTRKTFPVASVRM